MAAWPSATPTMSCSKLHAIRPLPLYNIGLTSWHLSASRSTRPRLPSGSWSPSGVVPPSLSALVGAPNVSREGLTVCGLPVPASASAVAADDAAAHDLPVGCPSFVTTFLATKTAVFQQRLRTLAHVLDTMGLNSTALHVITHILRVGAQGYFVHLFRFLPPALARPWATHLDSLTVRHLCDTLQLPLNQPTADAILRTPFSQGGLQFVCLAHEASLHFLSGALALHAAPLLDRALTINPDDLQAAWDHLQSLLGLDVATLFSDHCPRAACKKLRQSMAETLGREMRRQLPNALLTSVRISSWSWPVCCIEACTAEAKRQVPSGVPAAN